MWPTADEAAPLRGPRIPEIHPARHKSYVEKLTDKVSFSMVAVPGGVYLRGSHEKERGRQADEGPRHPVTIPPLWMGKCEVTWDEFDLYMKRVINAPPPANNKDFQADAVTKPTTPYADETWGFGRAGYPVIAISHHAAMEYCRWLSAKTGKYYRLPTEAEWEWACRAGTTTAYHFGDDPKDLVDYAWFGKNSEESTHPVGTKKPNPWGLYDMHGNVAEWCLDHYQKDFYDSMPGKPTLVPVVLPTFKRFPHVARGGHWDDRAEKCRSAARRASDKSWLRRDPERPQSIWWLSDADFVGFRVVCAVQEQDNLRNLKSKVTRESD
jgi:formylglycine-generating enzyme required for sulfatase activity